MSDWLAAKVVREHEPRRFGCACGAEMGDDIDYRWHLVNQTIAATSGEIAPVLVEFLGKPAGEIAAEITRKIGRGETL